MEIARLLQSSSVDCLIMIIIIIIIFIIVIVAVIYTMIIKSKRSTVFLMIVPSPVVDFFNRINLIYGTVCEYCTESSCPTMSGGPKFEYLWADGGKYKKPTALPAPQYISHLMDWVETQINDEHTFPVTVGKTVTFFTFVLARTVLSLLFYFYIITIVIVVFSYRLLFVPN